MHAPNWASQPHIPVEDYQGLKSETRGKKRTSIRPKGAQRKHHAIQQKDDSRFQLPDKPEFIKHSTGKDLSTTPVHTILTLTQNLHIRQLPFPAR